MDRIEFTEQEKKILGRSGDFRVVTRFRRAAAAVTILFIVFFFAVGFATRNWMFPAVFAALYALVTLAEKLAYARALAGYKSIIVKLCTRLNESNNQKGS